MSDETLNTLKLRAKGYERYLECNYHHYNLEEEIAHEVITRFNDYEKEIDKLKKQLEEERNKVREYSYKLSNFRCEETYENQQKEFIEYMTKTIEELECDNVDDEELKGYLLQRIDTFKEIFSKYKEIIGVSDDKTN